MRVLVVGSGGREHALIKKIKESSKVDYIACCPGNGGISYDAECFDVGATDIDGVVALAKEIKADLVVVAPDDPLVLGMVDALNEAGFATFGPKANAAIIEGSKVFSKDLMLKYNIPTAEYRVFDNADEVMAYIKEKNEFPTVIKADGLALGKGVIIPESLEEAEAGVKEIMEDKIFGDSGNNVVVEEFLTGPEVSVLSFTDGKTVKPMVSSKDHKKVFEGETGLNTGGMGTFSPSEIYTDELAKEVQEKILDKTLEGFKKDNLNYKGILFVGLMITEDGPKILEYNVRFGDPETQSVLFRLDTDLNKIISAILDNNLKNIEINYSKEEAICVMLTSGGYPENYEKGKVISGLENLDSDIVVFHSGTKFDNGNIVTNGGRVIGITAKGKTVKEAGEKVYENIKKINFEKMHYRKDIWK